MLDDLVKQFAGGGAQSMEGNDLFGNVAHMLQNSPPQHGKHAVGQAIGTLGGKGVHQSVKQGTAHATQQQRNGLGDLLLNAVEQGGGSRSGVLQQLGLGGGGGFSSEALGMLAQHVSENHGDTLAGVLGNHLSSGSGASTGRSSGDLMSLLGNPMARQIGMNLAKKLL